MSLKFSNQIPRELIFEHLAEYLHLHNLKVSKADDTRPWGGFFVIDESAAETFIDLYFPDQKNELLAVPGKLSPKILLVAPEKRLSWQYHSRRAEIWKMIGGSAGLVVSDTDEEHDPRLLQTGDVVKLKQGERHRLIGLTNWGIVAEIWIHSDPAHPSDEEDIVRLQDDFCR